MYPKLVAARGSSSSSEWLSSAQLIPIWLSSPELSMSQAKLSYGSTTHSPQSSLTHYPQTRELITPLWLIYMTSSYDMPSAWFVSKATSKCLQPDLLASLTNWPAALRCGFAHKPFASRHTIRTCRGLRPRTPAIVPSLNSHLIKFSSY